MWPQTGMSATYQNIFSLYAKHVKFNRNFFHEQKFIYSFKLLLNQDYFTDL